MQVHCISVSEHIWVGGGGPRGVRELPAGGIRASQCTLSSYSDTRASSDPAVGLYTITFKLVY